MLAYRARQGNGKKTIPPGRQAIVPLLFQPIRSSSNVISMEFLQPFLRRHFPRNPVAFGCFSGYTIFEKNGQFLVSINKAFIP